jgi:hypothetical protein
VPSLVSPSRPTARVVLDGYSPDDALTLARRFCEDVRRHYTRPEDIPETTARRLRGLLVLAQVCKTEAEEALADLIATGVIELAFGESDRETERTSIQADEPRPCRTYPGA